MVVRGLYGNKDYSKIFSNLMTVNGLMGGISGTIIAIVYQMLGSYHAALVAALVIIVLIGILLFAATGFIGKLNWDGKQAKQQ